MNKKNNNQINNTDYYRLPCGRFLEDYIEQANLSFAMGSAVKYLWRAGNKDDEPRDKDVAKANHYIEFMANRYVYLSPLSQITFEDAYKKIRAEVKAHISNAFNWDGTEK